jgi:hypothetical protein
LWRVTSTSSRVVACCKGHARQRPRSDKAEGACLLACLPCCLLQVRPHDLQVWLLLLLRLRLPAGALLGAGQNQC